MMFGSWTKMTLSDEGFAELVVAVLAGIVVILAAWDWLKTR